MKTATPLTLAVQNVCANSDFLRFFVFELRARTERTDGRTCRQTDGRACTTRNAAYRTAANNTAAAKS